MEKLIVDRIIIKVLAAFVTLLAFSSAHATLIGSTVNVSAYFPNSTTLFLDPGNRTVDGTVEYSAGDYAGYSPSWEIDISANQLVITDTLSNGFPFSGVTFNGWILDVITGPAIVSASVDASSSFSPFAISVVGGNLLLNYQGVGGPSGTSSVINFVTAGAAAVPEPGTLALMAIAIAGIGYSRRAVV